MSYLNCAVRIISKVTAVYLCIFLILLSIASAIAFSQETLTSKEESVRLQREVEFLYKQAIVYFKNKDYQGATAAFEKILGLDPDNKQAKAYLEEKIPQAQNKSKISSLYKQAVLAFDNKDYDKATTLFEEILGLDPYDKRARRYLNEIPRLEGKKRASKMEDLERDALAYFNRGNYEEANAAFKEVLALEPNNLRAQEYIEEKIPYRLRIEFLYRKGFTYFYEEDYEMAAQAFREILALDPTQEKAQVYVQRKIPLRLKSSKVAPLYTLPSAFIDEEIDLTNQPEDIVKKDPSGFVIIKNRNPLDILEDADYLYQAGEYEEALVLYSKVYNDAKDPLIKKRAEMARDMVDALLKAERKPPQEAAKDLEQAVKLKERLQRKQVDALYKKALKAFNAGDYDAAENVFKTIVAIDPKQRRAKIYLEEKIPYQLSKIRKREIDVLYKVAFRQFNKKNYPEALDTFNEILTIDPGQKRARFYAEEKIPKLMRNTKVARLCDRGVDLYRADKYRESAKTFEEVLCIDPSNRQAKTYIDKNIPHKLKMMQKEKIKYLYGQAHNQFRRKNYKGADSIFKEILAIDPSESQAQKYVSKIIPQKMAEIREQELAQAKRHQEQMHQRRMEMQSQREDQMHQRQMEMQRYQEEQVMAQARQRETELMRRKHMDEMASQVEAREEVVTAAPKPIKGKPRDYPRDGAIGYLYEEAFMYYCKGELGLAKSYFTKILAADPDQPLANVYLDNINELMVQ